MGEKETDLGSQNGIRNSLRLSSWSACGEFTSGVSLISTWGHSSERKRILR